MPFRFKLLHKGLVLIIVPLVFSIAFMIYMFRLIDVADQQLARHLQASKVLDAGQKFLLGNMVADLTCVTYVANRKKESFDTHKHAARQMVDALLELRSLLAARPATLEEFEHQVKRVKEDLRNQSRLMSLPNDLVLSLMMSHGNANVEAELHNMAGGDLLEHVLQEDKEADIAAMRDWSADCEQIERTLYGGVVLSVLLTLGLGLYFYKNILERLRNVKRNIARISTKGELSPPLGGGDEIAVLDEEVHETARRIWDLENYKNRMIVFVGRQLATPLNSINNSILRLSTARTLSDKAQKFVDGAASSLSRLTRLSDELLTLDTAKESTIRLNIAHVSLASIIERACESVEQLAGDQTITLERKIQDTSVDTDPDRLIQVLVNLLSNAIKFSPSNSTVTVSSSVGEHALRLSVKDRGRGMPEEFRQRLFSRFAQVEEADAKDHKGFGLGLSICKTIVDALNGTITVESKPGAGTTFNVDLPLIGQSQAQSVTVQTNRHSARNPIHRLLVDSRLRHKGEFLIIVPLALQLITLVSLMTILSSSAALVEESARTRQATAAATMTSRLSMQTMLLASSYHVTGSPQLKKAYEEYNHRLQSNLDAIKLDPEFHLQEFSETLRKGLPVMNTFVYTAGQDLTAQEILSKTAGGTAEVEDIAVKTNAALNDMRKQQVDKEEKQSKTLAIARTSITRLLIASAIIYLLLAVILVYITWQAISLRTKKLIDNSRNLLEGKALIPPARDRDEIGELDRALYENGMKLLQLQAFKQEMIAVVGHDLRSPLANIYGTLDLLASGALGPLSEQLQKDSSNAGDECQKLIGLINEILDVEKSKSQPTANASVY
jgi:signal transduction histidine kinase